MSLAVRSEYKNLCVRCLSVAKQIDHSFKKIPGNFVTCIIRLGAKCVFLGCSAVCGKKINLKGYPMNSDNQQSSSPLSSPPKTRRFRRKPGLRVNSVHFIGLLAWGLVLAVVLLTGLMPGGIEQFAARHLGMTLENGWQDEMLHYGLYMQIYLLAVALLGLAVHRTGKLRKIDEYNRPLLILALLAVSGIIISIFMLV